MIRKTAIRVAAAGLFLLTSFTSFAQNFTGGVIGGLIASQVDGDTYGGYKKAGVTVGGWVNLSVSEKSSFQLEINYIQKGSRHNPDSLNNNFSFLLMRLGYVEMPLLYQFRMKNKFYLEVGPSIGVLLHSKVEMNDGQGYQIPPDNPFRLIDVGIQVGVGYRISDKLRAGLRSGNSILPIRQNRVPGDRRRLWSYGQFNRLLALELTYTL